MDGLENVRSFKNLKMDGISKTRKICLFKNLKLDGLSKSWNFVINLPKMQRTRVAAYMILGDPFLVMARAPMFPEYEVTPQPEPMRPAQRQATPSIKIPLLTPSDGTGGAATILAAAK